MDMIQIKDYSFTYPQMANKTLKQISLGIKQGEFLVVCGKSGCGKSTLLRQLKTALRPYGKQEGSIFFEKTSLDEMDLRTQTQKIGFVMQDPDNQIVTDKVWHELAFGMESLGYDTETIRLRTAEMASYFGIQQWFYKKTTELSGGQKQLLNLASVMAMHPSLLILDEPTSQLDPIAASDFLGTVAKLNRELGTTVILTEHRLEEVLPYADRMLVMEDGEVFCIDTPNAVGIELFRKKNVMFRAMPSPMQIATEAENGQISGHAPMTVREGKQWLLEYLGDSDRKPSQELEFQEKKTIQQQEKKDPLLRMQGVWFRYQRDGADVIKELNMEIKKGEWYCLLGGNGTGKSTAMSLMCRMRKPYRGKIFLEGRELSKWPEHELYRDFLGVVPQNPQSLFVKKTVEEELYEMIGGKKEGKRKDFSINMPKEEVVKGIVKVTHLEQLLKQHPYDLSGGEQQRLALAKILLLRPKLLLMDEPTKGLDADYKEEFAEILHRLQAQEVTIVMVSHDIEFCARYADRCGLFFDGQIVSENEPGKFFAGNSFYTTMANRMVRDYWPEAVTSEEVVGYLKNGKKRRTVIPGQILSGREAAGNV